MISFEELQVLLMLAQPHMAQYADPESANGMCGLATDEFFDIVEEILPEAHLQEGSFSDEIPKSWKYSEAPHSWYLGGCGHLGHAVPIVDGWCVDWTARQFHPEAPFPLVFSMADIQSEWEPFEV